LSGELQRDLQRAALGGICGDCAHARLIRSSRGSLFLLCRHEAMPRYPRQPVVECIAYKQSVPESQVFED